jgi:selenocysteine lyase/cysteine desulfurase
LQHKGVEVRFARLQDDAIATAETFAPHIDERTKVITLSHVTFHAGQVHDLATIGRLCAARGIYLVVDAMQSVGVVPVDVKAFGISVLAAGTHKGLLVPQGLGLLYVRDGLNELQPAYVAMSSMARPPADYIARPEDLELRRDAGRFEYGNVNLPDLHALSASIDLIQSIGVHAIREHVTVLGDYLIAHLDALGIELVGPRSSGQRAHIYVLKLPASKWSDHFARNQVRVSPERGGIRVSFGILNNAADVDRLADVIRRGLEEGLGEAPADGATDFD